MGVELNAVAFRKAAPTDAERIATLINSAYRGEHSKLGWTTEAELLDGRRTDTEEILRLIAKPDSLVLLCLEKQEIIGSVHIEKAGDQAILGLFVVEPGLQGRGLGKRLLAFAEQTAQQEFGVSRICMAVITLRDELIAFYERRGYVRTGVKKPFPVNAALWTPKVPGLRFEILEKTV